ncbi:hypothetical protein ACWOA5_07615 [Granulicatella adiacens]
MPNEPLLTRKSYKEQLEKQNRELEELETRQERRESRESSSGIEEDFYSEREEADCLQPHRTPKSGLRRYNHFLNVWLVSVIVILIIVIAIQMFF